ncbi:MAG: SIS domain-containing protein [Armatimonadetes bacterium]|nr:SIS domain-containing protein [Armatimonadota bacterium]
MPWSDWGGKKPEEIIASEIAWGVSSLDQQHMETLADAILAAKKVFVYGAGRSGFMMQALAMRLGHLGLQVWVVGETTTPAIGPGDLLLVGSGSGQTRITLAMVEAARARQARTACITAHADSPVARACDLKLLIPTPVTKVDRERPSHQPPGSLFEQCLLVVGDALVMHLMKRLGTTEEQLRARHTKLE